MNGNVDAILVVEDDAPIRRLVRSALQDDGCVVVEAETIGSAKDHLDSPRPDLLILDLGLPDGDGVELIRDLRAWSALPILVLSARSQEDEKIRALDAGADDYLTKPFAVGELLARTRALLRRSKSGNQAGAPIVRFGDVEVDFAHHRVSRQGEAVHLSPLEYRLLGALVSNVGKVITHRHLLRDVWGSGDPENSHYVRVYVGHLRQKLERDPAQPRHILTETGVGYRFNP
jgi:two-component system, OmpR family, KDP operon response regulator KdpE